MQLYHAAPMSPAHTVTHLTNIQPKICLLLSLRRFAAGRRQFKNVTLLAPLLTAVHTWRLGHTVQIIKLTHLRLPDTQVAQDAAVSRFNNWQPPLTAAR
jgi:hypothetical protein